MEGFEPGGVVHQHVRMPHVSGHFIHSRPQFSGFAGISQVVPGVDQVGERDQVADWALRNGVDISEAERTLAPVLAYDA